MPASANLVRLAALGSVAFIAACAPEIEGRIYMLDVADVAKSGEAMIVPALLRIPETSEEECDKGLADLAKALGEITPLSDEGECVEVDNNQFSQFTLDLPIATDSASISGSYLAELLVTPGDGAQTVLSFKLNRTLEDVQDAIGRGESSGFSVSSSEQEQPKFIFTFENDGRNPVALTPNFVFLDDAPGLPDDAHTMVLERRDRVTIRFSDVVSAHIAKANSFAFATLSNVPD